MLYIGFVVGLIFGFGVAAMCQVAKRGDSNGK